MTRDTTRLTLLVLDDDDDFRASLVRLLQSEKHTVEAAADLATARTRLAAKTFDAVFADEQLPDGVGSDLIGDPAVPAGTDVVLVTGHATVNAAVEALRRGAADYLTKPTELAVLQATLSRLSRVRALKREVEGLREALRDRGRLGPIVGRSIAMQPVFDMIQRVAPTDASVLIQGESGTGKEVVAQALHELSRRKDAPLVAVNCGAIPENLIESEMFGHEKGSFTGADRQHRGFFERADGGTLFLDEISEMPLQLQVKLLRVLETGRLQRVGGTTAIQTDVRVLAATNREPEAAIAAGKLREDLFFRLAVFPIRLPPLREREGDVSLIAQHFLDGNNIAHGTDKRWAPGALDKLAEHEWRGNVRELRNAVQRAFILADDLLRAEDAIAGVKRFDVSSMPGGLDVQVGASIADVERALIKATLEHVNGDKPTAARILGISLKTLYNRLNVYDAAAETRPQNASGDAL
ncbi:MAG TPA: sigma-54 dependent transcriptional regulator [Planctomycetota bacterium]|jgi:DNA-binding NtrC family response regulator|nr:sigma-54 dependent transcriptional regulator [Planctomycetota bacterium]